MGSFEETREDETPSASTWSTPPPQVASQDVHYLESMSSSVTLATEETLQTCKHVKMAMIFKVIVI